MRDFKGYMTLEATLVMPIVIGVLVICIYLTNYMYARCILSQDSYMLAFTATSADMATEYGSLNELAMETENRALRRYFGNNPPSFTAEKIGSNEVRARGSTKTRHAAMGNYFLIPRDGWDLQASFTAKKRSYPGHVRKVKRVLDLGKKIQF